MIGVGIVILLVVSAVPKVVLCDDTKYEATWESIDSRPLPAWYDKAKFGIFIHWGIYSVPSYGSEWFWAYWKADQMTSNTMKYVEFMEKHYPQNFTYQEFAKDFTAAFFDPDQWADVFVKSGAKYVVLTSKHHEGYTLWPSKYSFAWNSVDVGPHRDLIGDLASAVRAKNLTFGVYHSFLEFFNPIFVEEKNSKFATQEFVDNKILPEMRELINNYKPEIIWSDGDWDAPDTYWRSTEFLAWLYNESPVKDTVVVNDRWGSGTPCLHGGFLSCSDRYNPGTVQTRKWENAMTIDMASWGYRREATLSEYLSISDLITELVTTVSCGGNLLLNIGPTKEGTIIPIIEERLTQIGDWLAINGDAIYETTPWTYQEDTETYGVWYTKKGSTVYATVLNWPGDVLTLASAIKLFQNPSTNVTLLGNEEDGYLQWTVDDSTVNITLPKRGAVKSEWAWVLKIEVESSLDV